MNGQEKFAVESMAGLAIKALDLQVFTHQEFIENFKPNPGFLIFIAKMSRGVEEREPGALAPLGLAAEEPAAEEEDDNMDQIEAKADALLELVKEASKLPDFENGPPAEEEDGAHSSVFVEKVIKINYSSDNFLKFFLVRISD